MKVYITYFCCDGSDYEIWGLTTDKDKSIQEFKEKHVPFLIEGRQPDTNILYMIEVDIPPTLFKTLTGLRDPDSTRTVMEEIKQNFNYQTIYQIDGQTVTEDLVVLFFLESNGIGLEDFDEDDFQDFDDLEWTDKLWDLEETDLTSYNKLVQDLMEIKF